MKFTEPISPMGGRRTNLTLHGRSVYRPGDVPGHNVFKGYSTPGTGDGVDLFAPGGTEVYALADGVQTRWQNDATRKEVIYLEGEGWTAVYAHINAAVEKVGARVEAGQVVGHLRDDLNDPHLHFELWMGGKAVSSRTSGGLRDAMRARLGLTSVVHQPGDPRLIVAKPNDNPMALDGLSYCEVPGRWNSAGVFCVDVDALAGWLEVPKIGGPLLQPVREALKRMGVEARFDVTHLHDANDPRIFAFTGGGA